MIFKLIEHSPLHSEYTRGRQNSHHIKRMNMDNNNKQDFESILCVLEKLDLNPTQQGSGTVYGVDCPKNRSHQMVANSDNNQWECEKCGIQGGILELRYHDCLSKIKSLNESIIKDLSEFNILAGTDFTIYEINEGILKQCDIAHRRKLEIIILEKEEFLRRYRILDQYRLSLMVRDLNKGKELNDDIRRWWISRY